MTDDSRPTLSICLGSSCFARGNNDHLPLIQRYLREKGLEDRVVLKGSRCEGHCLNGPNLRLDGELVGSLTPETLAEVLGRIQ
jgi:NADH:ubiquinone oxidoreductase subunit E